MFLAKSLGESAFFVLSELEAIHGLVHAFTTRQTDFSEKDARSVAEVAWRKDVFLRALGIAPADVILLKQVHSDRVVTVGAQGSAGPREKERADGILLPEPGRFAVIKTADCLPLLLIYPEGRKVCALHAGWRGTRERIAHKGASLFLEETGARPEQILVALGPCIRRCCYEVGPEVVEQFREAKHDLDRILTGGRLDLVEANRAHLEDLGITQIFDSGMCTACRTDLFYSYRREGPTGRMWALAGFRE